MVSLTVSGCNVRLLRYYDGSTPMGYKALARWYGPGIASDALDCIDESARRSAGRLALRLSDDVPTTAHTMVDLLADALVAVCAP